MKFIPIMTYMVHEGLYSITWIKNLVTVSVITVSNKWLKQDFLFRG